MAGRTLHFVIRSTDLRRSLGFLEDVFAMKVLRHEENAEPCAIACNGKYNSAWSKTMVGYDGHTEDKYYCLEVVHNYGVSEYPAPGGLRGIHVSPPDAAAALAAARRLGYAVDGHSIAGPDGYTYVVDAAAAGRAEPFRCVTVAVADLAAAREWYCGAWGFEELSSAPGECRVGWRPAAGCGEGVPLRLVEAPGVRVDPQIDGRHAVALPTAALKARYAALEKERPGSIVFPMRVLAEDKLGALYLAITRDPDGHELCTVSRETFDPAVASPPYNYPDWAWREQFTREGGAALVAAAPAVNENTVELREVSDDDWEAAVAGARLTVAWFTAEWCAPCRRARPGYAAVAAELGDAADFIVVDVDDAPDAVDDAEVTRPPTFQLWRGGRRLASFEGADTLPAVAAAVAAAARA